MAQANTTHEKENGTPISSAFSIDKKPIYAR